MKHSLKLFVFMAFGLLFSSSGLADNKAISMDDLLEKVKQGHHADAAFNEQRLQQFRNSLADQEALLKQTIAEKKAAEQLSFERESAFENNEQQISQLQERLSERLGSLKELFGVLQIVANDAQGQFDNSLVQIDYPERTTNLNAFSQKMGESTELPTVAEIEKLWFELHREMVESGKVVSSKQRVLLSNGLEQEQDVIRVGTFNLISDGRYVQRISETGNLVEYPRQPSRRYMGGAQAIAPDNRELIPFTIDPVRGQLIALLGAAPNLKERVHQGGVIGYIILALGAVVFLLALIRFLILMNEDRKIKQQQTDLSTPGNNPLGRILNVYQGNKTENLETLELKLGEAVLKEIPRINWGLSFLKISAALAPLLGLLGTVTGMIITFQAITLFGAGDPKLMAGGISQALVTTVLGLTVAIPSLLLHNIVNSKATKIAQIIEQEAVALVALQTDETAG